jgi:RNA polymerase sigma-70 factor, ECF subfamily
MQEETSVPGKPREAEKEIFRLFRLGRSQNNCGQQKAWSDTVIEKLLNQALPAERRFEVAGMEASEETTWIAASQKGDSLAFNRLVLRWEKPIYNLALRMLHDPDEAAEAAQEAFLSAFRSIRKFRTDSKFSTWMYRIAVNHCISRLRRKPPGVHLSIDDRSDAPPLADRLPGPESHESELLLAESRHRVRRAMQSLPPDQRVVVELKFFQDLTFEEISAICEVPLSTIKSRVYAGLESMKLRLGDLSPGL